MQLPHMVIIGAGIVGLSTAYALLKQGMGRVTVLEQAYVNHQGGASHGTSRLIRHEYGADRLYTDMVSLSLKRWKHLENTTQRRLYTPTGILTLGRENDGLTNASYQIMQELGLMPERLTERTCKERFSQFSTANYDMVIHNKNGGLLHASTCLETLRDCILDLGGTILENCNVTDILHDRYNNPIRLSLEDKSEILANKVVVATGSWVHHLLGELRLPVRLTRQYALFFANLPMESFGVGTFPAFMAGDLYGLPIYPTSSIPATRWLKAASHQFGAPAGAGEEVVIDEQVIMETRKALGRLIPALQKAEMVRIDSCIYDISPDETFILDYLPDDSRIIFATGLSGHGFKFGLLLGEMLSGLICEQEPVVPMERFRLERFTKSPMQEHSLA